MSDRTDCNDQSATINPEAPELCIDGDLDGDGIDDLVDNNCNGEIDEASAADVLVWYFDGDGDGFGATFVNVVQCEQPIQYVSTAGDCDDSLASINPLASRTCNNRDDDCNGLIDEGSGSSAPQGSALWFEDADSDGYGNPNESALQCISPANFVADSTDCDDANPQINIGMDEYCNGVDDNCDGDLDESTAVDAQNWYPDDDADGYGNSIGMISACATNPPLGAVLNSDDCDDSDPNQTRCAKIFNSEDDNCDGFAMGQQR